MDRTLATFLRTRILAMTIVAILISFLIVAAQHPFSSSFFEFGTHRSFEGIIHESPYPTLLLTQPNSSAQLPAFSRVYLANQGKWGAQDLVTGLNEKRVHLKGTLIHHHDQTMIEIVPDSIEIMGKPTLLDKISDKEILGRFTLRGEIVDSKCYLGVMKPGNLKPHRSCAIRCISGGIPPVFLVRDQTGTAIYFMLVHTDGSTVNKEVLDKVAEPLEITGEVERSGSLLILKSDPATYKRIG
ncbi:MAG: hypothetical protein GKR87_03005 [Kiritimatiellae bacterium]|nr:hypothetical protein [Kiritimatiellia bacterium]